MVRTRVWLLAVAALFLSPTGCKKFERGNFKTAPGYLKSDAVGNFVEGMVLGNPYDSILGARFHGASPAVTFDKMENAPGLLSSSLRVKLIQSDEDLMRALDLSVGVQSAWVSLDEKFTFSMSHRVNSKYVYLLVQAKMAGRAQQMVAPVLTDEARKLSPEQFYSRYGDRFAYATVGGAELYALIEFRTQASEDKAELNNDLSFSVWGVDVSTHLNLKMQNAATRSNTEVYVGAVGMTPVVPIFKDEPDPVNGTLRSVPQIPDFLAAIQDRIDKFDALSAEERLASQTLRMHFRSYFGLEGYPGLPADVEEKVALHKRVSSDWLLYRSLVERDLAAYYLDDDYLGAADPALAASATILADLRAHADALGDCLAAWAGDSLHPPPVPAIPARSAIEGFASVKAVVEDATHGLYVYRLANDFIPKRLTDYDIAVRHAQDGKLRGTRVQPFRAMPIRAPEDESPLVWRLYLVNEPGPSGNRKVLGYRWPGGGAAYFQDGIWNETSGTLKTEPGDIAAALDQLTLAEWTREGDLHKQFLLVNTASGLVLEAPRAADASSSTLPTLRAFTGATNQRWAFHMPGGSATYQDSVSCDDPLRCTGDAVYLGTWDGMSSTSAASCYCCYYLFGWCWQECCTYCNNLSSRWLWTSAIGGALVGLEKTDASNDVGCPITFDGNKTHYLLRTQSKGVRALHAYCSGNVKPGSQSDACDAGQGLYPQDNGSGNLVVTGGRVGDVDLGDAALFVLPPSGGGGQWSPLQALQGGPRSGHTATMLSSGLVLVVGGATATGDTPAGTWILDPLKNRWTDGPTLGQGRVGHTATLLLTGEVLVVGGTRADIPLAEAWLFLPPTATAIGGTWVALTALPGGGRTDHTATLLPSGRVLILGGEGPSGAVAEAQIFDPSSRAWIQASLAPLALARTGHTATLLTYGSVLVAGGVGRDPDTKVVQPLRSVEVYDPARNASSPVADLFEGRHRHTASLLPSGDVLVVGGQDPGDAFLGALLYAPSTSVWSTPAQPTLRARHTATTLSAGSYPLVAIAGGEGGNPAAPTALRSVQLFDGKVWRGGADLPAARLGHAAAQVPRPPAGGRPYVNVGVAALSQTCDPAVDCWKVGQNVSSLHDPTGDLPRAHDTPASQQWRIIPIENVEHF